MSPVYIPLYFYSVYLFLMCLGDFWSSLSDLFVLHIFVKFDLCAATDVNQLRTSASIFNNSFCVEGNKYIRPTSM